MSPKTHAEQEAALGWPCSLFSQEMWVLNGGGRRRQCVPNLRDMSCKPLLWVRRYYGHTLESHSPQKSHVGDDDWCLPKEGKGWSGARLAEETS